MCGRYTLAQPNNIKKRFNTTNNISHFEASYNISPSQAVPTIIQNSPNTITLMRWGFMPEWDKEKKYSLINIRKESTKEKPYFKKVLLERRCIVAASGFYEWRSVNLEGKSEKYPFYIYLKDKSLFGFAGLYTKVSDAEKRPIYTFAIITCPPNDTIKKVHHRMPVILEKKDEEAWLNSKSKDFDNLFKLLKPYPSEKMKLHPVSKRVNNPRFDDEKLIDPFEELKLF